MPGSDMLYDHEAIDSHAGFEDGLVASLTSYRTQIIATIEEGRQTWQAHGSNACDAAIQRVDAAFRKIFAAIGEGATQKRRANAAARNADQMSAARFSRLGI